MEYRVLGSLEVVGDDGSIDVVAPKQRELLGVLVVNANHVVSTDHLMDALWDDGDDHLRALRVHVSNLRDTLEPGRDGDSVIATKPPGYVLHAGPDDVDALRFERMVDDARGLRESDPQAALDRLDDALALWRGPVLADFAYADWARLDSIRLDEKRMDVLEERLDLLLDLGRPDEVVSDTRALIVEYPRRERLRGALMLALYRTGRQSEALDVYQDLKVELGEAKGIEPSEELRSLEERIVLQNPSLLDPAADSAAQSLRGYTIRGCIGEGAHGTVWRATQPGIGREVAVKALKPMYANKDEFVRRFEIEAQMVSSLEHPNIVSLFDFWREPEGAYLVMPYLRGGTIGDVIPASGMEVGDFIDILSPLADALDLAHRRGIIHGDITPSNVLLDEDGNPYLADFGVAALTGDQTLVGSSSPGYVAPEITVGSHPTPATDVFGLGCLSFHALTGQPPEGGNGDRISDFRADLPPAVAHTISAAMDPDPVRRPSRALGFRDQVIATLRTPEVRSPATRHRNPYKGLRAFGEADAGDFFGRDALIREAVRSVERSRLVGVVGPSGSGKSSLVRAGLIPAIRGRAIAGSDRWLVTTMMPGSSPLAELEEAVMSVSTGRPADLHEILRGDGGRWRSEIVAQLPDGAEIVLVVDQLEELWALVEDEDTRDAFLDSLTMLAADPRNRARVVVTLRADYFDRPLLHPAFGTALRSSLVSVTIPSDEGLRLAIEQPLEALPTTMDAGLADVIVGDVVGEPGGLALMEYALTELFEEQADDTITRHGYERIGGVLGALGRRAESLYAGLDAGEREVCRQVFLRLVAISSGAAAARRRATVGELRSMSIGPDALDRVLEVFGSHRLLTFDRSPETREPTVEAAHEALFIRWQRLAAWIDDRRDDLIVGRQLTAMAAQWVDADRDDAYLVSGGRLAHLESFADRTDLMLGSDEVAFIERSRTVEDGVRTARTRRRQAILAGFAAVALVAIVLAIAAFVERNRADDAAAEAQDNAALAEEHASEAEQQRDAARAAQAAATRQAITSRAQELALAAVAAIDTDADLAVLLALEAVALDPGDGPLDEAVQALHTVVTASRLEFVNDGRYRATLDAQSRLATRLPGQGVTVTDVSSRADLWSLPVVGDAEEGYIQVSDDAELSMAFNPDGSLIATGRTDGTVTLWDGETGEELRSTNERQTIALNGTEGTFVVTYDGESTDPVAVGADAATVEAALEALEPIVDVGVVGGGSVEDPFVVTLAEVANGYTDRMVVVASDDGVQVSMSHGGHDSPESDVWSDNAAHSVLFSDDGEIVVTRGWDQRIIVWDGSTLERIQEWDALHKPAAFRDIDISPNGELVAAAVEGHSMRVWEAATGLEIARLDDMHELETVAPAFVDDGTLLVAGASFADSLIEWELETGEVRAVGGAGLVLTAVDVSDDGSLIATAGDVGDVWISYTTDLGYEPWIQLPGHTTRVWDLDFAPDQRLLVSVANDARVWDLGPSGSREWATMQGAYWGYPSVSFNADGSLLGFGTETSAAVVVDGETFEHVSTLDSGQGEVSGASDIAFAPRGPEAALAVIESGGFVQIWDTLSATELVRPVTDPALLELEWADALAVDYSADGTLLAAAIDGRVVVWDVATWEETLVLLPEPDDWMAFVRFLPSGELVVRGTFDGIDSVRLFDADGNVLRTCCELYWVYIAPFDISPDGRSIATPGMDGSTREGRVIIWDLETGEPITEFTGHVSFATGADFHPDGDTVASIAGEHVKVWDAETAEELLSLRHGDHTLLFDVEFSPDGTKLVTTGDGEGLVRVWALDLDDLVAIARARLTRGFTDAECTSHGIEDCG